MDKTYDVGRVVNLTGRNVLVPDAVRYVLDQQTTARMSREQVSGIRLLSKEQGMKIQAIKMIWLFVKAENGEPLSLCYAKRIVESISADSLIVI